MAKKNIFYLFRRPALTDLKKAAKGQFPEDFFYGYTRLDNFFKGEISDVVHQKKFLLAIELLIHRIITRFTIIGFSLLSVIAQIKLINRSDLVFATVDSYGLPLAFLKSMGFVKPPVIINSIGLCDALIDSRSKLYIWFCHKILKSASLILSGASYYECRKMSKILHLPLVRFQFTSFGIDTRYFSPTDVKSENFALIIGADPKRDWRLLKKVVQSFPKINFVIVTQPRLIKEPMPENAQIHYNLPFSKVRDLIRKSAFALVLSKQNYHFAGQSTALRCMSCAKSVIFTNSFGVTEYKLKNYKDCILVAPGNLRQIKDAINFLTRSPQRAKEIGKSARLYVVNNCKVDSYAARLNSIFKEVLLNKQ